MTITGTDSKRSIEVATGLCHRGLASWGSCAAFDKEA